MTVSLKKALCTVVLTAGLAACSPGADLEPMPPYATTAYRLGAGDQIRIITFGSDQLSGQFNVSDSGSISVPLIGNVAAAGLSTDQLATELEQRLRVGEILRKPSVAIEVQTYRPIFVLGQVEKPGQYPFQPGMTMLTAVADAGGFTYRAIEDYAADVRSAGGPALQGKIVPNSFLAPGDVVKVFERHF